ncbi:MAG: Holliday junction branch migration protein RuvA [Candidatus Melainabacteria bacterium]|nr:Holliday junction branch migration protein RuvA [Candidatus Melainabacteria bacterium]
MYQFLRGIIKEKITEPLGAEKLILEVNGIGYEINTSLSALDLFGKNGETTTVYTTLIHKEDQMTLIGFPTLLERELFNLLFSVSGIGPKTALNLLNNLTVSEITYSILNEDISNLRKAQGIGERTASRIILELKEKIKNWKHLPIAYSEKLKGKDTENQSSSSFLNEARSVLQALGYSGNEINQAFSQAKSNGNHEDAESLIHFSLKWLASVKR